MKKKTETKEESQQGIDNRSRQLDPENNAFWKSRGFEERPENWEEILKQKSKK